MSCINLDFDKVLKDAIDVCRGINNEELEKRFFQLFPFTTENISGYINEFELQNKKLFTVGSSFDQVINASLFDCRDITVFDICPFTKFYAFLKLSCLLELSIDELLSFLTYRKYFPLEYKENGYSKSIFDKIKSTLKILDYDSYVFWDMMFDNFSALDIRMGLFYHDEISSRLIKAYNPYLQSDILYNEARKKVKNANIDFVVGDILTSDVDETFDTIWLSNIGTWSSLEDLKLMVDKMSNNLKDNGDMLISYLYQVNSVLKEEEDEINIYNKGVVNELLKEYHPEIISFIGTRGLKFHDKKDEDAIIVYHKGQQKKN